MHQHKFCWTFVTHSCSTCYPLRVLCAIVAQYNTKGQNSRDAISVTNEPASHIASGEGCTLQPWQSNISTVQVVEAFNNKKQKKKTETRRPSIFLCWMFLTFSNETKLYLLWLKFKKPIGMFKSNKLMWHYIN